MDMEIVDPEMEVPDLRTWPFKGRRRRAPGSSASTAARTASSLDSGVTWLILVSCALVPVLFIAAMFLTWDGMAEARPERWWFCMPPLAVSLLMGGVLARTTPVSGWVRAAVLVPILHVMFMAMAWLLWRGYAGEIDYVAERLPLLERVPAPQVALALGGLLVLLAGLPMGRLSLSRRTRGRVPTWLRAVVAFALAQVLLLGLWLPVAAMCWQQLFETRFTASGLVGIEVAQAGSFIHIALIPPAVGAALFALASIVWPHRLARMAGDARWALAVGLAVALICRLAADFEGFVAYANLVHVLLAEAVFCLLAVMALGLAHARIHYAARHDARSAAPWVQRGTVVSDTDRADVVATLHHIGWLHGLRGHAHRFWLRTDHCVLEVPAGTRVVAPVPLASIDLDRMVQDERCPLVRAGDELVVSGYVEPQGDGVFRRHAAPVPGPDGLLVSRARGPGESVWRDVQLLMWRPCVLYLLCVSVAALPAVAALLLL